MAWRSLLHQVGCSQFGPLVYLWVSTVLLVLHHSYISAEPLTRFIRHFEPLDYDTTDILKQHHRAKRSVEDKVFKLDFSAHGRSFKLRLKRDSLVFSPDVTAETSRGPIGIDIHNSYVGYVQGVPDSHLHGVITTSGLFEGSILLDDDVFIVEKAERYFPRSRERDKFPHSVIYKESDIDFDLPKTSCHSTKFHARVHEYKKNITSAITGNRSAEENESQIANRQERGGNFATGLTINKHNDAVPFSKSFEDRLNNLLQGSTRKNENQVHNYLGNDKEINRWKEQINFYSRPRRAVSLKEKRICELYLQADHLFYQHHGSNTETVIEQLTHHVQAVNAIYKNVDFDKDGSPDEVGFIIKKLKIHTDPTAEGYRYNGNYGVEKFLELVSEENYDFVCLSYMFTYRDFEGGTLGLAWTADLYNAGGICDKYNSYQGAMKSLNTGIVTVLNFGQFVPPTVSHVTLAHEIGHNMGAPHDPAECTPSGDAGNYIMYARATSGDRPNNEKFSSCSINKMGPVIEARGRSADGCFTVYTGSMCGNKVVEDGEECDCGWEEECQEQCCHPQTADTSAPKGCTLKTTASCSPSAGVCCTDDCKIVSATEQKLCRTESSCQEQAFCDGVNFNAVCPSSMAKPNKTECGPSSVCFEGECTGSLCVVYGLESCQCSPSTAADWHDPRLCHLCCKTPEPNSVCRSSHDFNEGQYRLPNTSSQPGSPCNNYQGFCDVFHKCREVDPSGPLQNIQKLLFSGETIATLKEWLQTHWYAAVGAGIGIIIVMALFIKLCSRSTIPRKAVDPLRQETSRGRNQERKLDGIKSKRSRVAASSDDHKV